MKDYDQIIKEKFVFRGRRKTLPITTIVSSLLFLISIVLTLYFILKRVNKYDDTFNVNLSGIVTDKIQYKGAIWVTVNNDSNSYVLVDSYNYNYKPSQLNEFLELGDSIIKPINTDSLFIYRDNNVYLFLLGNLTFNRKY